MRISFITYGCKVNQAESQWWEKKLGDSGYEITQDIYEADLWIVNTCAVTHKAEVQSRQIVNKAKKLNKKAIVTGCYVNLAGLVGEDGDIKYIPNEKKDLIINEFQIKSKCIDLKLSRHRAIVKVQDGCNNYCSYCVVPFLRGQPRSKRIEKILDEISEYRDLGIREIVLSGINLGLYGIDFAYETINLNTLIKVILKKTDIPRIRLSSIEINHINDEFLELISDRRICRHLHVPLQSGSDRILKLMNRPYRSKDYIEKFEKLLKHFSDLSIGTDVIVGFPTESQRDFNETLNLLEELSFSYIHVFSYSKRPKTTAEELKEQVSEAVKKERAQILGELAKKKRVSYMEKFIDSEVSVIVENKKNGFFSGTSDNYIKCLFRGENINSGEIVNVKIEKIDSPYAIGSVVF